VLNADIEIDDTDLAILDLLAENARRTFGDIGSRVGLSAPAAKRRVDRLEAAGIVLGYTTRLDYAKVGRPLQAFLELRFAGSARVDTIATIADEIPEVQHVYTIAGDPDALAQLRVRDVDDLKRVIDRLRSSGPVTGTKTLMVLGTSTATPQLHDQSGVT
jgi:Lrp/AsnC family transcriptional regulator, leucine-responsive regulatory protein